VTVSSEKEDTPFLGSPGRFQKSEVGTKGQMQPWKLLIPKLKSQGTRQIQFLMKKELPRKEMDSTEGWVGIPTLVLFLKRGLRARG